MILACKLSHAFGRQVRSGRWGVISSNTRIATEARDNDVCLA